MLDLGLNYSAGCLGLTVAPCYRRRLAPLRVFGDLPLQVLVDPRGSRTGVSATGNPESVV